MVWWYNDTNKYGSMIFDRVLDPWTLKTNVASFDVNENDAGLTLNLDLPGAKSADLKVEAVSHYVKIEGKQKGKDFSYNYSLPKSYDPSTGRAKLEDGVLTMTFNKLESSKPRVHNIPVK